jgi:two-component system sensor histidine kinase QseC
MNGRSIQLRLSIALSVASLLISAATGALLYHVIGRDLVRSFDRSMYAKASALSQLVTREPPDGHVEFEFLPASMPEFEPGPHAEYFEIVRPDGSVLSHSRSLGELRLPSEFPASNSRDVRLPSGRIGRATRLEFLPQPDPDLKQPLAGGIAGPGPLTVVLARDRAQLDGALRELWRALLIGSAVCAAAAAAAAVFVVRRALRPLRVLADQAAGIDADRLDARLGTADLPDELVPICARLNDLLHRLEQAFARERRFTADVAHELRTPIAELRSVAEVALRWPPEGEAAREAFQDTLDVARQMEMLVSTLLAFVRSERHPPPLELSEVRLAPLIAAACARANGSPPRRDVQINVPSDATVRAEPALLGSVMANLLCNAIEYGEPDAPVRCEARAEAQGVGATEAWCLTIENATRQLREEDLAHIFEAFWRKDAARSNRTHLGLGLPLVRSYCARMGINVSAQIPTPGIFRVVLTWPPAAPAEAAIARPTASFAATEQDAVLAGVEGASER